MDLALDCTRDWKLDRTLDWALDWTLNLGFFSYLKFHGCAKLMNPIIKWQEEGQGVEVMRSQHLAIYI